jgi:hypothetical protein
VHDRTAGVRTAGVRTAGVLDQPGHGDTDAQDVLLSRGRLRDHRADAPDHMADRVLRIEHRHVGCRQVPATHVQPAVEQLDQERGLSHVDADHVAVIRIHLEQPARPAAARALQAHLGDQPLRHQVGDEVADRRRAEAGQGGAGPYTTLATSPETQEEPFL